MLELWGMRSTPSLPSLPGPLWPGVVAPDKGPIYGLNRTTNQIYHHHYQGAPEFLFAQSTGAVEYTDCFSAEG